MTSTDKYAYLWEGSEPGWVLLLNRSQRVQLTAHFPSEGPSPKHAKILREAVPLYKDMPAPAVLSFIRGKSSLSLGEFEPEEGHRVAKACQERGLAIEEFDLDSTSYLPFNEITKMALLIEDDLVSAQVHEEALRHGIEVKQLKP